MATKRKIKKYKEGVDYKIYFWKTNPSTGDYNPGFTIEVIKDNAFVYGNSNVYFSNRQGQHLKTREWFFKKYPWTKEIYSKLVLKAL